MLPRISLSIVAADFISISEIICSIASSSVGIHLDFMDGKYSDSLGLPSSWSIDTEKYYVSKHYMTDRKHINENSCNSVIVPISEIDILKNFKCIRSVWITDFIDCDMHNVDYITLLSVNPGFSGQDMNVNTWYTAEKLKYIYGKPILLDGGINDSNISKALDLSYHIVTGRYGIGNIGKIKCIKE